MFIDDWVEMGLPVKTKVIAEQGNIDFLEQCESCAKVSYLSSHKKFYDILMKR
jgi:hypothetical protein